MPIEDLGVVSGVIQALIFFSFLAAIILVPRYLSYKNRSKLHETLRAAIEKGQPMPPELIDALRGGGGESTSGRPPRTPIFGAER